jgi:hypothetical protein
LAAGLGACDAAAPPSRGVPVPAGLQVEILNPDRPEALRCNPEIRLGRKVSAEVLESLSRRLLEKEAKDCSFGFAAYYLAAMRPGSGAWAIAELGPEISVSILGLSAGDEETLLARAGAQAETFGVWVDDSSYSSVVSLYRDGGGLKLTRWYPDGGRSTEPIRIARRNHGFELHDSGAGSADRHYRLGTEGDLETWDSVGFLSAARKARLDVDLATLEREDVARRARRSSAASTGRTRARAAAAEERWRKFDEWRTLYHGSLDPARHPALFLGALQDEAERDAACARLTEVLSALPPGLRAAPSQRIDVDPLLLTLDRLREACSGDREIGVLLEAAAVAEAWRKVDRSVEQVVSELRPEEE